MAASSLPITPMGDTDLQKDALSQALRNKRLNSASKKSINPPPGPDDNPGNPVQDPST